MAKQKKDLTAQDFLDYGMSSCPSVGELRQLGSSNIEMLIYVPSELDIIPRIEEYYYTTEIFWTVSPNNTNWFVYEDNKWVSVTIENFIEKEWKISDIYNVPESAWVYLQSDRLYFKACLITNKENTTPKIISIEADSVLSYIMGQEYIYTASDLVYDTSMWLTIEGLVVDCDVPKNTDLCFLFSIDDGVEWKTFDGNRWVGSSLNSIYLNGLTPSLINKMLPEDWLFLTKRSSLSIAIGFRSKKPAVTPKLRSLYFIHTEYDKITETNVISIPTPSKIYKQMELDESYNYVERDIEGIGFDDYVTPNAWFTTPNKIHLRIYDLGTLIGSRPSDLYRCVVKNTYAEMDCDVTLKGRMNGEYAMPMGTYGLLPDSDVESAKTQITFYNTNYQDEGEYPLSFVLRHRGDIRGDTKVIYFKVTPTTVTVGKVDAEIVASYTKHLDN